MGSSVFLINVLTSCPPVGRCVVRSFVRSAPRRSQRANWLLGAIKHRLTCQSRLATVSIGDGLVLEVDWNTTIGREIYFHGTYEPEVAQLLRRLLKPGMVAVDAGANVGELTVRAAHAVGPTGRVLAVEPSPSVHARLARNVVRNRFEDRVCLVAGAASSVDGQAPFYFGSGTDSLSSSLQKPADYAGKATVVRTSRLDTCLAEHNLARIDLIKLDVEGAEYEALLGAQNALESATPPYVIFEHNAQVSERSKHGASEVVGLLDSFGYRFQVVGDVTNRDYSATALEQLLSDPGAGKLDILATPRQRAARTS